jgi:hypothetical protein
VAKLGDEPVRQAGGWLNTKNGASPGSDLLQNSPAQLLAGWLGLVGGFSRKLIKLVGIVDGFMFSIS